MFHVLRHHVTYVTIMLQLPVSINPEWRIVYPYAYWKYVFLCITSGIEHPVGYTFPGA